MTNASEGSVLNAPLTYATDPTYLPIDFIKAHVVGVNKTHFTNNNKLDFIPVLGKGGEWKFDYTIVNNMKLKMYENRIELSGSLHKYYNQGLHNYCQFDLSKFNSSLVQLYSDFGLTTRNLIPMQLELGFNITPPINTRTVLNGLIEHKGTPFSSIQDDFQHYTQAKHKEFIIKLYDKALQYGLDDAILRYEIKHTKFCRKLKHGLETLHDFLLSDKSKEFKILLDRLSEVTYCDLRELTGGVAQLTNNEYWSRLRDKGRYTTVNRRKGKLIQWNNNKHPIVMNSIRDSIIQAQKQCSIS